MFIFLTHHLVHVFKFTSSLYFQQTGLFFCIFVRSVRTSVYLKLHMYPNTQVHIVNIFLSPLYCCIQHVFIYICINMFGVYGCLSSARCSLPKGFGLLLVHFLLFFFFDNLSYFYKDTVLSYNHMCITASLMDAFVRPPLIIFYPDNGY